MGIFSQAVASAPATQPLVTYNQLLAQKEQMKVHTSIIFSASGFFFSHNTKLITSHRHRFSSQWFNIHNSR
jgi:hypothetical protein